MNKSVWIGLGAALALSFGVWMWSTKPTQPSRLLMRHFEVPDLLQISQGRPLSILEPYEAFVYGHPGMQEPIMNQMVSAGNMGYRYFNVLELPYSGWVGRGNRWFDFVDSLVVAQWGAVLSDSVGVPIRFAFYQGAYLFDWSEIDSLRALQLIDKQLALRGTAKSVFLDQYWQKLEYWMAGTSGPPLSAVKISVQDQWSRNIATYLRLIRSKVGKDFVITNGDRTTPPPVYLENSNWIHQWPWKESVSLWRKHPKSVLSVDVGTRYEDSLLVAWKQSGGTIAVTGTLAETQSFYTRADQARMKK